MTVKSQIRTGIALSYFNFLITAIMGLLYIPYLIRVLPESEYGLYLLMYSFMSMLSVLDLGMTGTIVRYYSKYYSLNDEQGMLKVISIAKQIYTVLSICLLVVGIVMFLLFELIYSNSLSRLEIEEARYILILITINAMILIQSNIYIAIIQANERFIFQRSILIIRTLVIPIIALVLTLVIEKAIVIFATHLGCNLCFYICYRLYVQRYMKIEKAMCWDNILFKEILSFAFFLFLNTIVDELYWNTNLMILGAIGGAKAVAVYGTANIIVTQFRGLSSVIHGIFLPRITKLVATENKIHVINKLFLDISKIQFLIVFVIYSGFFVYGKEFVILWAGMEYIDAYYMAMITMTALLIPLTQSIGISILRAYNRQKFRAILYIIMAISNVCVSIPAAYKYQGYGCAAVTAFFLVVGNTIIMNVYYQTKINLDMLSWWEQFLKLLIPVIIAVLLGMIGKRFVIVNNISSLAISIIGFSCVYFFMFFVLGFNSIERKNILQILERWR